MLRIHFRDDGQDCLWWDVDERCVVQGCDMQAWAWKGTTILTTTEAKDVPLALPGDLLFVKFKDGTTGKWKHPVEKVEMIVG